MAGLGVGDRAAVEAAVPGSHWPRICKKHVTNHISTHTRLCNLNITNVCSSKNVGFDICISEVHKEKARGRNIQISCGCLKYHASEYHSNVYHKVNSI